MDPSAQPAQSASTPQASVFGSNADLSGLVLGDFKLLRQLGQGGMGQVYLAEQFSLRRQVALKIVRPEFADKESAPRLLARFRAEAEAVARATHANIVQIFAIGQVGDVNFMALEYVEGRNLREFVEKKKPISISVGLKIMTQVAAALQRAAEVNMVHRDIKPENILVTRNLEVKVADFGLSRCFDRQLGLTSSGVVMGTPLYMSPEQVEPDRPVDHRSDLYALGATSYFMFAAVPPFQGDTPIEVAYQHVQKQPTPLSELRPDLPPELCALIHKLMAKKPEARYQSARELARDIEQLRSRLIGSSDKLPLTARTSIRPIASDTMRLLGPARTWVSPRTLRHAGLGLMVALALVGGMAIGWYRQHRPATTAVPVVPDEGHNVGTLFNAEFEKRLLIECKRYQPFKDSQKEMEEVLRGLKAYVELGVRYLEDRRLDDAEKLFGELCPEGNVAGCNGRLLKDLGQGMVLAFRDKPAESNERFLKAWNWMETLKQKKEWSDGATKVKPVLKNIRQADYDIQALLWQSPYVAPKLRQEIAFALEHNKANDEQHFPDQLRPWLNALKPAVKKPGQVPSGK
jgi:serine/threonine-protein kinase